MSQQDAAYHYSKALFNLTKSSEELLRSLPDDLADIALLMKNTPRLQHFLSDPKIDIAVKEQLLQKCLQRPLPPILLRFIFLLAPRNRLPYLAKITQEYRSMAIDSLGIMEATVVTAVPMTPSMLETLRDKIAKEYRRSVVLKEKIDPQIIGGVIVLFADYMIDWSIKGRLARLEKGLLSHKVLACH